jgi:hypothetical protein
LGWILRVGGFFENPIMSDLRCVTPPESYIIATG